MLFSVLIFSFWCRERHLSARIGIEVKFVAQKSYQSILNLKFAGSIDTVWICDHTRAPVPLYQ
ncbi:hypothetical protein D8B23_17905 [Verminephrobacter aporrectodeae subsp. tuberculatae]|uniref:Uncharacterized protein n=1 Tax=Verminephrobacter aporrectodeae subsp. tuberculatae TaxID=1110392 RepID=A0ABT3KS91_9BURK|nr:hypothetical protein [Verminephrobacter aporrectodeae subsp. tuberculatae]MCW5256137.1 hypothetical protein [Verminephrobacter aporrectodeae subsp. tuberculatae]MCW5289154.1 hypothetical protein [Verminephrobacter aporrectodeae subsp. tuberculatae]MCW5321186.1 hypothetical protein [Verminephrobacter aporrectodeae subsp. tuberculatae]MCW8166197.1 hypothetical protein [Verminephrobacter aporrectodeae subsp. tuberculatae]